MTGYRIDAAKHMWPGDITATLDMTRDTIFGSRPYVFQEVIDLYGSEPIKATDYTHIGQVTEFKYGKSDFLILLQVCMLFTHRGSSVCTVSMMFTYRWSLVANCTNMNLFEINLLGNSDKLGGWLLFL